MYIYSWCNRVLFGEKKVSIRLFGLQIGEKMKQKTVMKVHMSCQKCRTQALQLAATADGATFVGLEGPEKDKVVVIGEGVDAVKLAACLRKKVGHTELLSVAEVK